MCGYQNLLSLSPYAPPSVLRCAVSSGDYLGTCRLPPNSHGDACASDSECASGHCLKEISLCKGVDPGQPCVPGYPSPCGSFSGTSYFCNAAPAGASATGYTCQAVAVGGTPCSPLTSSCQRGYYCVLPTLNATAGVCRAPFSIATGSLTNIGPFMCAAANALMVQPGVTERDSMYLCADANATSALVGTTCDPAAAPPAGFECICAQDGTTRLRTVGRLGIGSRSGVWSALYSCLMSATNMMGDPCEFSSQDLYNVRYGSCAYYACYPYYQKLVAVTGGRMYNAPLAQFEPLAQCEVDAVAQYYAGVSSAPCLTLPGLSAWKCATLQGAAAQRGGAAGLGSITECPLPWQLPTR